MPSSSLLSKSELNAGLEAIGGGWEIVNGALGKTFAFDSYLQGADFARSVAGIAEDMNHHPEITILWRKVALSIFTHSAGGLTALDLQFATEVEKLAGAEL